MSGAAGVTGTPELLRSALRSLRRSAGWWALGLVAFGIVNVAFWPSLEGTDALAELEDTSGAFLEAFGAQGIATPAGYLDGQLFAFLVPLLLSGMAIATVTAVTSGDEHAGRLELVHALPVGRRAVWLSRVAAAALVLAGVAAITAVAVVASLRPFSLDEVAPGRVVTATIGAAVLAAFHGAIAYAIGAAGASRAASVGLSVLVLVAGYVAAFLLPIADALEGARRVSPWHWALGQQPVSDGVPVAGIIGVLAATAVLVAAGTWAVDRRDITTA